MEKKTIGGFIAVLRKANGMTQRDLAERLNVSDKTVSRWERDDGVPDLTLIPVIAEIFNVSCDELLKGERNSNPSQDNEAKGEKQKQHLLKSALLHFKNHTYVSIGISILGVITALVCNLAFLKAVLGFFLGLAFFLASIICQLVFANKAFFSVENGGGEESDISSFKRKVIGLSEKAIGLAFVFIGFTFPLSLMDAYMGLSFNSLLLNGTAGAVAFFLLYVIILYFFNAFLLKRGVYSLSEKESVIYLHNHKMKRTYALILAFLLAITFLLHQISTSIWGPFSIMKGTTFNDYESFIEYMEEAIPREPKYNRFGAQEIAPQGSSMDLIYYDSYGNVISEEEALTRYLEDKNGNVVCKYIDRNESVISIQYSPKDGTVLPLVVYTEDNLQEAKETAAIRNVIFVILYLIECLTAVMAYYCKREK